MVFSAKFWLTVEVILTVSYQLFNKIPSSMQAQFAQGCLKEEVHLQLQHLPILQHLQHNLDISCLMWSVLGRSERFSPPLDLQKQPSSVATSHIAFFILSMLLGSQGHDNSLPLSSTMWPHSYPPSLPAALTGRLYFLLAFIRNRQPGSSWTLCSRTRCLSSVG